MQEFVISNETTIDEQSDIELRKLQLKKYKRKETLLGVALVAPFALIFVCFTLVPFVMGFVFSFMRYNPYDSSATQWVGLQNYTQIFDFDSPISELFWNSFGTMFVFDIVAVPMLIIVPFFLAYFINMHPPGYKFFRVVIYLPTVVSISIMGIIFGNMFASNGTGLINSWFGTDIKWLSGTPWHGDTLRWLVILIATLWWQTGSNFIIFASALRNVPQSLYEACEMDGGGRWKRILYVTIPNIKSSIGICLFNTLISYLGLYGQVYVLNDLSNQHLLVSPMMFLQYFLMEYSFARQTGMICAFAIIFGLITMAFGMIERKCMAEHRKKGKYTVACEQYRKDRRAMADTADVAFDNEWVKNNE